MSFSVIHKCLADILIGFSCIFIHLPAGASGIVTTHTISNLSSFAIASKKGIPIGALEKNTTL